MTVSRQSGQPVTGTGESVWTIFLVFLRLGLTSFGGPVAHLGYFREEFVSRRRWLSERNYADLVALCQFLPGPASSQVGMALGLSRHGYGGALAAWAGFALPSAILLILFALGLSAYASVIPAGALHGLKIVAVAVVAQAVWGMARNLCTDIPGVIIMALATGATLLMSSVAMQTGIIVAAGVTGLLLFKAVPIKKEDGDNDIRSLPVTVSRRAGAGWLALLFGLMAGLPALAALIPDQTTKAINAFFQAGAMVFGGGHVVLPLLQAAVVPSGWISNDIFLAGYGAAQAVPGPLFTFAAFLGASMSGGLTGWMGGVVCLLAIFVPSFLLVAGALPFWERIRHNRRAQAALSGVNAAVVGLLLAALYNPVWTSAIYSLRDFGIAVTAFIALMWWKLPPWLVVAAGGITGWLVHSAG